MKNNPKHILFTSAWFPSRDNPYPGDFVQRHAKAVSLINKVTVLHVKGEKDLKKIEVQTNKQSNNYTEIIVYFPKSKISLLNAIHKFRLYNRYKKSIPPFNLIHANIIYYDLIWVIYQRLFFKTPFVITEHWTGYYSPLNLLRRLFSQWVGKQAHFILPVSQQLQKAMQSHNIQGKYKVIPNVVDTQKFTPKKESNQHKVKFLHLSMLKDSHKNISGQLQAALLLSKKGYDFEFEIGGTGNLKPIKDFIKEHGLEKIIKPFSALTHDEVVHKMQEANCFILFSNHENQPCVITESFAVGTPVISTNVGGIAEFFPANFGTLIDAKNVTQLVNAMEQVIQGKTYELPQKMHEYVNDNFSTHNIAHRFNDIYNQVLQL